MCATNEEIAIDATTEKKWFHIKTAVNCFAIKITLVA